MKKKIVFILTLILLLVIVVLSILFFIKFYKVNKIIDLMKINLNKQNYSYFEKDFNENVNIVFINHIENITTYENQISIQKNLDYYNFNSKMVYHINNISKTYIIRKISDSDNRYLEFPFYNYLTLDFSFKNKLKLVFDWKIKDTKNNCYEITTKDNYKITFDKNNGLVLRVKSLEEGDKFEEGIEDFKENSVTEEDVKLPDLTEYTQIK